MEESHFQKSILALQQTVTGLETEVADKKRLVNMLCAEAGADPIYNDIASPASIAGSLKIKRGQFFKKKTATAIREYLDIRHGADLGPATVDEIFEALEQGGFEFESKRADMNKRGLSISLAKNTQTFQRLPDGSTYGLAVWWGGTPRPNGRLAVRMVKTDAALGVSNDDENETPAASQPVAE